MGLTSVYGKTVSLTSCICREVIDVPTSSSHPSIRWLKILTLTEVEAKAAPCFACFAALLCRAARNTLQSNVFKTIDLMPWTSCFTPFSLPDHDEVQTWQRSARDSRHGQLQTPLSGLATCIPESGEGGCAHGKRQATLGVFIQAQA
jgi:hypothetical protein